MQPSSRLGWNILDSMREGCQIIGQDYRYLYLNPAAASQGQRTPTDLIGRTMMEAYPGIEDTAMFAHLRDCLEKRTPQALENEFVFPDGSKRWFDLRMQPIPEGVLILSFDLTQPRSQEARITRLTGLYAVLSHVNEAVVRARDAGALYQEVCRIVAGEGELPLAWIGLVEGRRITPVACCGPARGYLEEVLVEVDGPLGNGPTGTCIREGRPVINDDFDTNASTASWREPALRHGFRASAAFPLRHEGQVMGALTLYAPEPGTFDHERVTLLKALADDVSYALDALEARLALEAQIVEQQQTEQALRRSRERQALLALTAEQLLQAPDPQAVVESLCAKVMEHLDCQTFFNFMVEGEVNRLRLNAYAGIPTEAARAIERLDYGVAVCGCVARDGKRMVAEHIQTTPDVRTDLVKSFGIQAYVCHPLLAENRLIGTLSFGTRTRTSFRDDELELMKAVADQVAIAMDRIQKEQARGRLLEKLQRANRELNEFAHAVSHDLKAPLRAVSSLADMLVADHSDRLDDAGREQLNLLIRRVHRMHALIDGILNYSRLGRVEEQRVEIDLNDIVAHAVDLLSPSAKVSIIMESKLPQLLCDPARLGQVFQNLIGNALKYMDKPNGEIRIGCAREDNAWRFSVADNGPGIEPRHHERIFKMFQTLQPKDVNDSTGIGLAVVKRVVEDWGGRAWVESEVGKGSTFYFTYPSATDLGR